MGSRLRTSITAAAQDTAARIASALNGQWGIADVDDVISALRFSAAQGKADEHRAVIRGGSAGGYTTLAALTFHPEVFKAGASYYGISDLEALEIDTHKFESRYSHSLIAPYPAAKDVYYAALADPCDRPAGVSAHPVPGT